MTKPIAYNGNQPYIFISYAHKDAETVLPIIAAMQARGYRVWYDAGIEGGTEWPEYIATHLDESSCVIAFLSESSVNSPNCRREINFSIELCKELLCVYLEPVKLTLGMRMQLNTLQALFLEQYADLEAFLDAHTENTVKYIIDKSLRWELRDILDQLNINERMIYPGTAGIAQWLARHYYVKD